MHTFGLSITFTLAVHVALAAGPPNIIVIYTDDQGYADLSCQNVVSDVRTPNIDALAAGGVRMTNGYVTAPQCVPSRAGLLTGRYQTRFGLESNQQVQEHGGLDGFDRSQTIAERLKRAGYATGMAGKWHLGPQRKITSHGFDFVFHRNDSVRGTAKSDGQDNKVAALSDNGSSDYHIDGCTTAACRFIRRHRDQPFFIYLAYRAPHVPLDPPQRYLDRFTGTMPERRRKALAMLSAVDDGVGRIMATLADNKLIDNTLVFFISDNGAPLKIEKRDAPGGGPGWNGSLNEPLNGEKGMLTEGGIRIPFIVHWKGRIPGGQIYAHPVISLDVAATANSVAGLPDDPNLDGVNLIPFLTGARDEAPHKALFWRWSGQAAVRQGNWKLLTGGGREYLFNLEADIEERQNLVAQHPELASELRAKLKSWAKSLKPPGLAQPLDKAGQAYFDWYLDGKKRRP